MKSFSQFIREAKETVHHVFAMGRMNPITTGHQALIDKVHSVAKKHNAGHTVILSHSHDPEKNPLSPTKKLKHAKRAFPGTNFSLSSKEKPSLLHHISHLYNSGVRHLHVVTGSDRAPGTEEVIKKYNGKKGPHGHYNFKSITMHSAGERDPDAKGTTGISASKMRAHAAAGDKKAFHAGAPSNMSHEHRDEMYHDVRKGMGIK
jgi:hypothetical protein